MNIIKGQETSTCAVPPTVTGWAVGNPSLSLQSGAHAGLPRLAICVHSAVSNRWAS